MLSAQLVKLWLLHLARMVVGRMSSRVDRSVDFMLQVLGIVEGWVMKREIQLVIYTIGVHQVFKRMVVFSEIRYQGYMPK